MDIKDINLMSELEEKKYDASDFLNTEDEENETPFKKEIKEEEIDFEEEVFCPEENVDGDGNYHSSRIEEKMQKVNINNDTKITTGHEKIIYTEFILSSVDNENYCRDNQSNLKKYASGGGINLQASCSGESGASKRKRINSNVKLESYPCTGCKCIFNKLHQLIYHSASIHGKLNATMCSECGYPFSNKRQLTGSISSVPKKAKPFKCTEGHFSTTHNGYLKRYIETVHSKFKPYKCPECEYSSDENSHLTRHITAVHGDAKIEYESY